MASIQIYCRGALFYPSPGGRRYFDARGPPHQLGGLGESCKLAQWGPGLQKIIEIWPTWDPKRHYRNALWCESHTREYRKAKTLRERKDTLVPVFFIWGRDRATPFSPRIGGGEVDRRYFYKHYQYQVQLFYSSRLPSLLLVYLSIYNLSNLSVGRILQIWTDFYEIFWRSGRGRRIEYESPPKSNRRRSNIHEASAVFFGLPSSFLQPPLVYLTALALSNRLFQDCVSVYRLQAATSQRPSCCRHSRHVVVINVILLAHRGRRHGDKTGASVQH